MNRLMVCLLLPTLLFGLGFAQDQPQTGGTVQLLNCLVEEHLPEEPARAEQGGYLFEYQSLRGVTEDGRVCLVYRLKNAPDKPPTPFRWTLGDEVVVDKVRLARCGGADCPWLTFAKYFAGEIDTNLSVLSYGLNADAYHEQADTYMNRFGVGDSEIAEAQAILATSVGTELAGVFSTEEGESVAIHLLVKSRFEPDRSGGARLIYEVEDLSGGGMLASGRVRLEWEAFAAVEPVTKLLAAEGGRAEVTLENVGSLSRTENALIIVIPAESFVLDEAFWLRVYADTDDEPLVSVPMPAYVPSIP